MLETFRWLLPHAGKLRTAECPFAPTTNTGNFWRCLMLGAAAGSCCMLASYCWILVDIGGLLLDTGGLVLDADWLLLDYGGLLLDAGPARLQPDDGRLENDRRRMAAEVSPERAPLVFPFCLASAATACWLSASGLLLDADWLLLDIGGLPLDAGWLLPDAGGLLDNDPRRMLSGVSPGRAILSLPALLS